MRTAISLAWVVLAACSCSDPDSGNSTTGGVSSTGGVTSSGGATSTGGSGGASSGGAATSGGSFATGGSGTGGGVVTSGGTATGGAAGKGGANSSGGAVTGGNSTGGARGGSGGASGSLPAGKVTTCFGNACPLGECDNGRIAADVRCADVYPAPVTADSTFCASGASGDYCLTVSTSQAVEYWQVTCAGGAPKSTICPAGCGIAAEHASCN